MNKRNKQVILSLLSSTPLSSPLLFSPLLSPSKLVWLYRVKDGANAVKLSGGN